MKTALAILIAIFAKLRKREEPEPEQIVGDVPHLDPRFFP